MLYSERLKEIREINGLKQEDLGNILSINKRVYSQYEREYTIIPIKHLNTLCNYFNISFDYIFNLSNLTQYSNYIKEINKALSGQRLKEFRTENKITIRDLAKILNVATGTISGYESGRYLIATPFLYSICKKYNISADYLLGKIDEPKYLKK